MGLLRGALDPLTDRRGGSAPNSLLQLSLAQMRFPAHGIVMTGLWWDGALYPCIGLQCSRPGIGDEESTHRQKTFE